MSQEQIYKEIIKAIIELNADKAAELVKRTIEEGFDILEVIEKGFGAGIRKIGELWEAGEFYLPELIMGGNIIKESIESLTPYLRAGEQRSILGRIVIATIENDIHSIGKTIVGSLLSVSGFEVHDLGTDVSAEKIVQEAIDKKADVIGVSALLTTTMPGQKKVVEILVERGLRENFKVIIGGAPVTERWVKECGADGYAPNAFEAVKLVKELLG